jgi:hypothetical protein
MVCSGGSKVASHQPSGSVVWAAPARTGSEPARDSTVTYVHRSVPPLNELGHQHPSELARVQVGRGMVRDRDHGAGALAKAELRSGNSMDQGGREAKLLQPDVVR